MYYLTCAFRCVLKQIGLFMVTINQNRNNVYINVAFIANYSHKMKSVKCNHTIKRNLIHRKVILLIDLLSKIVNSFRKK